MYGSIYACHYMFCHGCSKLHSCGSSMVDHIHWYVAMYIFAMPTKSHSNVYLIFIGQLLLSVCAKYFRDSMGYN